MRCAIWYHLYNLKNVKNTHRGVLLLVIKVALLHGCLQRFLNDTNGTKPRNASHMYLYLTINSSQVFTNCFKCEDDNFHDSMLYCILNQSKSTTF